MEIPDIEFHAPDDDAVDEVPITRRPYWVPSSVRTELCDLAEAEMAAKPRARRVRFKHRGEQWQAMHTGLRLIVRRRNGQPVCCRWM